MSSSKRQDIFKDINPLIKIYGNEDTLHYLPPAKRKQITEYMGKVGKVSFEPVLI